MLCSRATVTAVAFLPLAVIPATSHAQENLLPSTAWGFAPAISVWRFDKPLAAAGGGIKDVAQAAVPFQLRAVIRERWNIDLTGAYAAGGVHLVPPDSTQADADEDVHVLAGPTDLKLRIRGPIVGDNVVLTAGLNFPTGRTRLDPEQTGVLQALAAPGLHMPIGAYGSGAGGTLGLIGAAERGDWALALGGSIEKRTEYTPIALAIAGGNTETRLKPGTAAHFSLGADRPLGESRFSVLVLGDMYASDNVVVSSGGAESGQTQYQLGPQVGAVARLDFGGGVWREGALAVSARHRSAFTDADGNAVRGSDGNYFEGSLGGTLGGVQHPGLMIGVDGRWHSGLPFTNTLVGAAVTAAGATIGVHFPGGVRFVVHPQYGSFDTGLTKTTGIGATVALSIFARGPR